MAVRPADGLEPLDLELRVAGRVVSAMQNPLVVAIVGSGFAGSILARLLARGGHRVVLIERGRHPRFTLGESSTPLAGIALERLARTYSDPDLGGLATWGRWQAVHPDLGCGLKRGFTFYRHHPGAFPLDSERLLVAASPDDEVADCHWLRSEVDAYCFRQAKSAGVEYLDETEVTGLDLGESQVTLHLHDRQGVTALDADFMVDASGSNHLLEASGVACSRPDIGGSMICAHLDGAGSVAELAEANGSFLPGPFPDERSAVHHLIDEGWIYSLRFDDGRVSVGLQFGTWVRDQFSEMSAEDCWSHIISRYPALRVSLAGARLRDPSSWRWSPAPSRRLQSAGGSRWFALPHSVAFYGPLFSTGIAWSLLGVERLAELLLATDERRAELQPLYSELVGREALHIESLHRAAWACLPDFDRFRSLAYLYFSAASWSEIRQRLLDPEPPYDWAWHGFLGADDPLLAQAFRDASRRCVSLSPVDWQRWVAEQTRGRDLIGLGERLRIGVDLQMLRDRVGLIGLSTADFDARAWRLRGLGDAVDGVF